MLRKMNVTGLEIVYVILTSFSFLELGQGHSDHQPHHWDAGAVPSIHLLSCSQLHLPESTNWALSLMFPFGNLRMIPSTISTFSPCYPIPSTCT